MKNVFKLIPILFLMFSCQSGYSSKVKPPNIIVILTDDLSWSLPGFNGGTLVPSPNLDQLAKEGTLLTQFYMQSVCAPTRANMLTGRYPFRKNNLAIPKTHGSLYKQEMLIGE